MPRVLNIGQPPDPAAYPSPVAWQRAAYDWMQRMRGVVQDAHNEAVRPAGQQFLANSFTLNTVATGTITGTDLANCLASLVQVLTDRGILSPTVSRSSG